MSRSEAVESSDVFPRLQALVLCEQFAGEPQ